MANKYRDGVCLNPLIREVIDDKTHLVFSPPLRSVLDESSNYWMNKHWPLVLIVPEVKATLVQQHNIGGIPEGVAAAPYDGVAEAWFDDIKPATTVMTSENWAAIVAYDDENFLDRSKTLVMFSTEMGHYRA
jgi:uncharacterized protein (TIGR02118 family)